MWRTKLIRLGATLMMVIMMTACSHTKTYQDGIYKAKIQSETGQRSICRIEIAVENNRIAKVNYQESDFNDKLKDETYGADSGDANYQMAQLALEGINRYGQALVETQDVEAVEAIAGATVSLDNFQRAANEALENGKIATEAAVTSENKVG